jgi:hypothetical protein
LVVGGIVHKVEGVWSVVAQGSRLSFAEAQHCVEWGASLLRGSNVGSIRDVELW